VEDLTETVGEHVADYTLWCWDHGEIYRCLAA
jgi:hypothetical protein